VKMVVKVAGVEEEPTADSGAVEVKKVVAEAEEGPTADSGAVEVKKVVAEAEEGPTVDSGAVEVKKVVAAAVAEPMADSGAAGGRHTTPWHRRGLRERHRYHRTTKCHRNRACRNTATYTRKADPDFQSMDREAMMVAKVVRGANRVALEAVETAVEMQGVGFVADRVEDRVEGRVEVREGGTEDPPTTPLERTTETRSSSHAIARL